MTSKVLIERILNIIIALAIPVSSIGLLIVYVSGYIAEVHMAKAIPLAIVFGFSLLCASLRCKR